MARIRLPWRQDNSCPLPPFSPTDRRRAIRHTFILPVQLRLGNDLLPGRAVDLSDGGIGVWFDAQAALPAALESVLASHERGAIEFLAGGARFVARVRVVHVRPGRSGMHV